jgi:hypothetical protein
MRDVTVGESLAKNPTQLPEFGAFYDTDRLKTCESVKEREIIATHLIIRNDEADQMIHEYVR